MSQREKSSLDYGAPLPQLYGEDRLVILPRDPHCIFCYWELSPSTRETLKEQAGAERWPDLSLLLRVFKHSCSDLKKVEGYFDLHLGRQEQHRYIAVPDADRPYHLELGWTPPQGSFQVLLRSRSVRTPRDGISDLVDEDWQLPDWKARKLYRRISLYHLSSAEFLRPRKKIV